MIHKSFSAAETKVLGDPGQGLVECVYSATGNVDRQGDRIVPGAFAKALAVKQSVPVVFAHAWTDISQVLGRTTSMTELMPGDPRLPDSLRGNGYGGVKATIQFEMGVESGRTAFTHLKNGNLGQYSFAFDIDDDGEKYVSNVREIKSIREVFEVTVALIGANQLTTTVSTKQKSDDAEQWARISQYIAKQVGVEDVGAQETKAIVSTEPDWMRSPLYKALNEQWRAEWEASRHKSPSERAYSRLVREGGDTNHYLKLRAAEKELAELHRKLGL